MPAINEPKEGNNGRKVCVAGLGYVGLPLAVALGKKADVIGFDVDEERIGELRNGKDRNADIPASAINGAMIEFTSDPSSIRRCDFIIVAVPTPIDKSKRPDMSALREATAIIGRNMTKGTIVVFESTVYPGVTEEICVPILSRESGLEYKSDFKVGYSPERINPGDKVHTVDRIVKVVSGCDSKSLDVISDVYGSIVDAGIHRAPSIRVAEAAKIIENVQRDINIALMNELKIIFDKMGIDIDEVLKAAGTKWNFLRFHPGLVGGHCIGIDPYYLAYKSEQMGHRPEMILAGRHINDEMAKYEVSRMVKDMKSKGIDAKGSRVLVLGATFKPDLKDLRNSKIEDVVGGLKEHGCAVDIHEPLAREKAEIFGCRNVKEGDITEKAYDYMVLAVNHRQFKHLAKKADYII